MKRRFFIQGTTLGSIGLGLGASDILAFPMSLEYTSVKRWLSQLSWTLSVQRRTQARSAPESFCQASGARNEYFACHGFYKMSDTCYFFGENEEYCFYPLVARDQSSGMSDLLMPVFRMHGDQWQPVQTLSGFQVEALMKASHALRENSPAKIQHLLFPIGKANSIKKAGSYATREGTVSIVTTLKKGRATTTCTVMNRNGKVFHETFSSSHSLVC